MLKLSPKTKVPNRDGKCFKEFVQKIYTTYGKKKKAYIQGTTLLLPKGRKGVLGQSEQ
jgi:hypothetical protein